MESAFYEQERALRNEVLLRPFGIPDFAWEMHDQSAWHIVALESGKVVGCVLLVPREGKAQLMQMAVRETVQRKGVGKLLIQELLCFAKQKGIVEVFCHSRSYANDFYLKMGFTQYGETFEEVGMKHNFMRITV